ncbi:MAG: GNAT family N-acetyltransferase [Christensenellaceae bacterium]|nr:GNAT family N-acetyltransferase [Christensenellaceae bacterium]
MTSKIRWACPEDKNRIRELWEICFADSKSWCDWFFEEKYSCDRTLCFVDNNEIVSDVQYFFYPLRLRETVFNAACVLGVATHPDMRRKGLMGELMICLLMYLKDKGVPVAFLTPAQKDLYRKYGFAQTAVRKVYKLFADSTECPLKEYSGDMCELLCVYRDFAAKYSCMVDRSIKEMTLRVNDVCADGGKVITADGGYCLVIENDKEVFADEFVYSSAGARDNLTKAMLFNNKPAVFSLPEDEPAPKGAVHCDDTYSNIRILDVCAVLSAMNIDFDVKLGISDSIIPQNNGVFACDGTRIKGEADVYIDISNFAKLISGYAKASDVIKGDKAVIKKLEAAFEKTNTFTIETY